MSRKCNFNSQFKGALTRMFTEWREEEDSSSEGGEKRSAERSLTQSVHDLALSQVCATGGAKRKEAVHAYAARA